MSASPAPTGTPDRTPNGVNHVRPRPRPPVDPLVKPKRRPARPGQKGAEKGKSGPLRDRPRYDQVAKLSQATTGTAFDARGDLDYVPSGFSSAPVSEHIRDYPLVISKRAFKEGLRNHVAKFFAKKPIDPRDQNEFTRPVRLQRRDARAPAPGQTDADAEALNGDPEERERRELERAERAAKREIELAQIAPSAITANKRVNTSKKKTERVYRNDLNEGKKAASQLRYEEALQWHLEDFDSKQSWVGSYEAALSGTYAHMELKDGKFKLTPLEKWYKFTPKMHIKPMELEEAEKKLNQVAKEPIWLTQQREQENVKKEEERNRKITRGLYVGKVEAAGRGPRKVNEIGLGGDVDELDFEEDRFADDEENELFEGDLDEVKDNQERIKKDQLQANIFDMKPEAAYDKAEADEMRRQKQEKHLGKRVKKALMKREKNRVYDSDSEHPYSSQSVTTDSEAERTQQEQAKKEAEEKAKGSQGASGNNSSKNNTPSKSKNLKRVGSANASDMSGNESSRKKQKLQHSRLGTGANTPNGTVSRSGSPGLASSQDVGLKKLTTRPGEALKRARAGAGSGSEGEGAAGSGGEMSDGMRKKIKLKSKPTSMNTSPRGSRAGSVDRDTGRARVVSPAASPPPAPLTEAQIREAIPEDGITLPELVKKLGKAHFAGEAKNEMFKLVKTISKFDKESKRLKPLPVKT